MKPDFKSLQEMIVIYGLIDWNLYYPDQQAYAQEIIIPQATPPAVPGGAITPGTAQITINVNAAGPFLLLKLNCDLNLPEFEDLDPATGPAYAPTQFVPNAYAQLYDSGVSQNVFNNRIHLRRLMGDEGLVFDAPRIVGATTTLDLLLWNYDTTRDLPAAFTFWGARALKRSTSVREIMAQRELDAAGALTRTSGNPLV